MEFLIPVVSVTCPHSQSSEIVVRNGTSRAGHQRYLGSDAQSNENSR
ncbi:IS1 family transposase [Xenorhabdus lircayensis]|uniref:InsA N-terminal zinc ribbon domain-containing protein n=1 Tax=Xenorhabdus lircayensis TaxID=2763499 RepID=A0ABS0U652_9GAMM|nr:hypothetical protein [Xenorhabdus lircayensis]